MQSNNYGDELWVQSFAITPPLLKTSTFGAAPPLKIRGGWGSYDSGSESILKYFRFFVNKSA